MKKKKLIILLVLIILILGAGITYSYFNSSANLSITDRNIAKFIFNAEVSNDINIPLLDLKPGDELDYLFSVSNNEKGKVSEVTILYQITINTYHFVPLVIKLYKLSGGNEELLLNCDESYSRNEKNELVCNSKVLEMTYTNAKSDDYRLEIVFPKEYNDITYSEIVDYINLDITSQQKN